jgi:hypothetical protein
MDDSEIRHAVEFLATAYRELATLVDHAELEGLEGQGHEAHVHALPKACRDLTDFAEIVGCLAHEAERQSEDRLSRELEGGLESEYFVSLKGRLRAADRIQLEAVLRTQKRTFPGSRG